MWQDRLRPDVPEWALEAGCPPPKRREKFCEYVNRLGLECEPLLEDLDERTAELAHYRLGDVLRRKVPGAFEKYAHRRWLEAHIHDRKV